MYLITSAARIDSELQSEFGPLPPSFLPVGNRRLFYHQLNTIPCDERVVLTLPEGFVPGSYDKNFLEQHGVEILYLPTHLSLGSSIVYALNLIEFNQLEPLFVLHGDTLLRQLPLQADIIGLSEVDDNYSWAEYDQNTHLLKHHDPNQPRGGFIANGFFSFSQPHKLIKHITLAKWDFIEGLNGYHQEVGLNGLKNLHWLDFGHIHTYYSSKSKMTTQRAFNEIKIHQRKVIKCSSNGLKLAAEAQWYQNLPGLLKIYTPQLLHAAQRQEKFEYRIEYLHLTTLSELFVFSLLPEFVWEKIIKNCCQFIKDTQLYPFTSQLSLASTQGLFMDKTLERLGEYAQTEGLDIYRPLTVNGVEHLSLHQLASESQKYLPDDNHSLNVIHGDLCFSNIFYDFRIGSIKVIDPRGLDENNVPTIYGNSYYDIAKLAHSIIGHYDFIIAGYFEATLAKNQLNFELAISSRHQKIIDLFTAQMAEYFDLSWQQLCAMQIQLFLSMLPLHSDRPDRQLGFIGNTYRLYNMILGADK